MNVEILQNFGSALGPFRRGEIHDIPMCDSLAWIEAGLARETDQEPPHVERLLARLDDGAGKDCLFLPSCAEFGHLVMSHIRMVHFHRARSKIVCCRQGEEVLYPSATGFCRDWIDPIPDAERAGTIRDGVIDWTHIIDKFPGRHPVKAGGLTPTQELYCIRPEDPIPFHPKRRGFRADVVFGPRRRQFQPEKNWPHWQRVHDTLKAQGFRTAIVGARATSFDIDGVDEHSGDHDTDAAIELLQNCRLFIGSDTGSAHLASTVGCPMLIFGLHDDDHRDFTGRMELVNRKRTYVIRDVWDKPDDVAAAALSILWGDGSR